MVIQQHAVAGGQLAGLAPLGLERPAGLVQHAPHAVIGGQPQGVALGGLQAHDLLGGGAEEALGAAGVIDAVDAGQERRPSRSPTWRGPSAVCTQVSAVTQGLVARMFSHHQLLFISLTRSMSTKPGSAKS
jgi:hypothetical protein